MKETSEIPDLDEFRKVFMTYTEQAFAKLPKLPSNPCVLDVGCGSGESTLALARLIKSKIIGMDIDHSALSKFKEKLENRAMEDMIQVIEGSFIDNKFPDKIFDLVWAEGVFHIIGYDKSLKESSRILKDGGTLVALDTTKVITKHLKHLKNHGFEVLDKVVWKEGAWWTDYYQPMEQKLKELREAGIDPALFQHLIDREHEIAMVKRNPTEFDCAHYIYKKIEGKPNRKRR